MIAEIAEYVPMGFFMYHEQGERELILSNSRLAYMFGCSTKEEFKEFTGNSVRGLVHPEDFDVSQKSAYMGNVIFSCVIDSTDIIARPERTISSSSRSTSPVWPGSWTNA